MMLMAAGALMAPGIHPIAAGLGEAMSAGQIAWACFFFQLAVLLPFLLRQHGARIPLPSLAHASPGVLVAAAALFFFWALRYVPLAIAAPFSSSSRCS
jgi:drug/metabolite transporter (DMT)-like permease